MKLTALACAVLFSVVCFAASPAIGTSGEVPLMEGSAVQTDNTTRDIHLDNGASLRLAAHSAGTIFGDHAILDHGAARLSKFAGYRVDAGLLHVESETPDTQAVIRIDHDTVQIASIGGDLTVSDGHALLTRVSSGTRASFQNTGATPGSTGAHKERRWSETKTWVVVIVGISAAALALGLTAIAQGKSL